MGCGAVTPERTCRVCGALVLFDDDAPEWSNQAVGLRFERCTVHGASERPEEKCTLSVDDEHLSILDRREATWLTWDHGRVQTIAVDDYAGMKARLTATRFVVLGALAFFVPKRTSVAYLSIQAEGASALVEVPGVTPPTLRAQLSVWLPEAPEPLEPPVALPHPPAAPAEVPTTMTHVNSIKDRLQVLDALLADGAITPEEHSTRRATILDSI
jgi:hypothetical protein